MSLVVVLRVQLLSRESSEENRPWTILGAGQCRFSSKTLPIVVELWSPILGCSPQWPASGHIAHQISSCLQPRTRLIRLGNSGAMLLPWFLHPELWPSNTTEWYCIDQSFTTVQHDWSSDCSNMYADDNDEQQKTIHPIDSSVRNCFSCRWSDRCWWWYFSFVDMQMVAVGWGRVTPASTVSYILQQVTLRRVGYETDSCHSQITNRSRQLCASVENGPKGKNLPMMRDRERER